jgi:hypothetical protein
MAKTSSQAPYTVQIGGLTNSQQRADGLPSYRIYANIPGSPNQPGPRSPGSSVYPGGLELDSEGYPLESPQDPAPIPPVGRYYRRGPKFIGKPVKLMWEPSVFVPGKGWVNSANSKG